MLKVKEGGWFGRLDDDSRKVKWMRRVYPRVDYAGTMDGGGRRRRGPLLCLGSRAKASALRGRHRRFAGGSAFHMSIREILCCWRQPEVVSGIILRQVHSTEFDST